MRLTILVALLGYMNNRVRNVTRSRQIAPAMRLLLLAELSLALITGTGSLCAYYLINYPTTVQASTITTIPASTTVKKPTTPTPTATPAPTAAPVVNAAPSKSLRVVKTVQSASSATVSAAPVCSPGTAPTLAPLKLSTSHPGLNQVIDPVNHYTIYGTTTLGIYTQMFSCTPISINGQTFAGSTNYYMNAVYDYNVGPNNSCRLTNIAVGLHINQIFPDWQGTAASPLVASNWQRFITNLTTHEQGHINLDEQYANLILHDLQNYPATACASIGTAVQQKFMSDLAALNAANDNYDAVTNHGATQGAQL